MQVTGLRSRFFAIILTVLLVVTTGSIYLYSIFLRQERLALIDQQVRETASALVDSQLGDLRKVDFDEADDIISEELGESRIGKFFVIRNNQGETIFESTSARLLPIPEIPKDHQWFEITAKGKFIRGLNLKLPRFPDRTLQVGLVLDESIVNPSYFSKTTLMFMAVVLLLGLIVSLFLTSFLLRPIALLGKFLSEVTVASRKQNILPLVPEEIARRPSMNSRDEFERVIANLNGLIEKVNKNYEFSRLWAYQMAHELKTPLSIANLEIEKLQKKFNLPYQDFENLNSENLRISETINSFLGWAELENSSQQKRLFMNRPANVAQEVVRRLQTGSNRIALEVHGDPFVPSNPQHLEQLIQNLVQNALIHTGPNANVTVQVFEDRLLIQDEGPGIPQEVVSRLGEPFNRGNTSQTAQKGHGLGLAWVKSVCRLYGWDLEFSSHGPGTEITIHFRNDAEDSISYHQL